MASNQDSFFLKQTLMLARKRAGWTFPNPLVGAVIVKNGKILSKGYHRKAGLPHAEVEALRNAQESVQGATLYVNLEPCSHVGKTPPCVDALIQARIGGVVCCTLDPNPLVHGRGIRKLQQAGISVSVGVLKREGRVLNEAFFTFHEKNRPFVAIKFAASLDGRIATKTRDAKWITNEKARRFARLLRSQHQAVIVGVNTVIHDNPHLGVRIPGKKDPLRIVLDSTLKIPLHSQVLRDANVLLVTTRQADEKKYEVLVKRGVPILTVETETIQLVNLLQELKQREIISLFVEGGSQVLGGFVDHKLVDKVYAFYAPLLIGGKQAVPAIGGEGVATIPEALHSSSFSLKRFTDTILLSCTIN